METNDIEKKFKRKMIEVFTMCDVIKELNLSLDLDVSRVIDTFTHSVAGLFLIERAALILLEKNAPVYILGDDAEFQKEMDNLKVKIEKIYPEMKERENATFVKEIKEEEISKRLNDLKIELIIPMFLRKDLRAIFLMGKRMNQEPYSNDDKNLLFAFANQTGVVIENVSFLKKLQRHVEELTIFNEVTAAINSDLDINILLDMVIGILLKMLDAYAGFIIILRQNKSPLFFIHQELDEKKIDIIFRGKDTEGMISKILSSSSEKLLFFNPEDAPQREKELFVDSDNNKYFWFARSLFIRKENIIGVVGLAKKIGETLTEEDVNLFLTFTSQLITIVLNARLYELAITDGLTGLFVHSYFEQRLREEISRARRYSSSVSVIMMDIDHFKECNDQLGHPMGNVILKRVSSIISLSVRKNEDIPSRWGGDEFAIILPETAREGASVLAERIRKNIETVNFTHQNKTWKVTVSMGISSFPSDAIEEKDLINQADSALYQAKKVGGNKVFLYGLMDNVNKQQGNGG